MATCLIAEWFTGQTCSDSRTSPRDLVQRFHTNSARPNSTNSEQHHEEGRSDDGEFHRSRARLACGVGVTIYSALMTTAAASGMSKRELVDRVRRTAALRPSIER
jgi:hypothetical protein